MNKDQSQTLTQIIEEITGARVNEKKGSKFYYNLYLNSKMAETPLEAMDLSPRSYNSLKRAGYMSIGDLAGAIASGVEISKIRNCGAKSRREIMERLFLYQYESLPAGKRAAYINEVMLLNASKQATLN